MSLRPVVAALAAQEEYRIFSTCKPAKTVYKHEVIQKIQQIQQLTKSRAEFEFDRASVVADARYTSAAVRAATSPGFVTASSVIKSSDSAPSPKATLTAQTASAPSLTSPHFAKPESVAPVSPASSAASTPASFANSTKQFAPPRIAAPQPAPKSAFFSSFSSSNRPTTVPPPAPKSAFFSSSSSTRPTSPPTRQTTLFSTNPPPPSKAPAKPATSLSLTKSRANRSLTAASSTANPFVNRVVTLDSFVSVPRAGAPPTNKRPPMHFSLASGVSPSKKTKPTLVDLLDH